MALTKLTNRNAIGGVGSNAFLLKRYDISDAENINSMCEYLSSVGGGTIFYGFNPVIDEAITLRSDVLHNLCNHMITQEDGANVDIYKTVDFDILTGVGPLVSAPSNFGVINGIVDGNWLDDFESASDGGDATVNNTVGYGFKIFGSQWKINVQLNNCAQIGFYSEAYDYTGYGKEQSCDLNIFGRVFGKEAVIYRGPADVYLDKVFMGCAGWFATEAERSTQIAMSELYSSESYPVHVMVSDEDDGYNGHHEFGMMHLYGCYSGYGYYCKNTGRLKGNHLVVENCRGGFHGDARNWGGIAMLEAHSNGRQPSSYVGTLDKFYDIYDPSTQGFNINGVVRRSTAQQTEYTAYRTDGTNGKATIQYYVSGSDSVGATTGVMAEVYSDSKSVEINCVNTKGRAVVVDGIGNDIRVTGRNHTEGALVYRVAGATSGNMGNKMTVIGEDVSSLIYLDGLVTAESWDITGRLYSGQSIYESGSTALDLYNRAITANISVRVDSTGYSSRDVGRTNLDNTVTTDQTITVTHGYFQTPDLSQVSFNICDPSPLYTGGLSYCYLQSVSSTSLTFAYKLSSVGTSGPLVLCWRID